MKILLVDDSRSVVAVFCERLHAFGNEVCVASHGGEGVEQFRKFAPDLVLMDIEMPEMDGYTLTAEIRNNPALRGLHIILHTSLSGVFNQAMVQKVGANNFIAKFNPDELAKAVQDAM